MYPNHTGERLLTELDFARLSKLGSGQLPDELSLADLVPSREIAPDVVTMYSQVEIAIGSALLGLRVGDLAHWRLPNGEARAAEVAAILFQPEASGDYTT